MAFLIKYQAIKGFFECDQVIKVKFRRSKILIPVEDGSTVLTRVTTPCIRNAGGQQQSKMASKISRSQDFYGISIYGFLWISGFLWDLWDFYGIIYVSYGNNRYFTGKYIAWDFGSQIQARFQLGFQHLRPRFQLVADPSTKRHITYKYNYYVNCA